MNEPKTNTRMRDSWLQNFCTLRAQPIDMRTCSLCRIACRKNADAHPRAKLGKWMKGPETLGFGSDFWNKKIHPARVICVQDRHLNVLMKTETLLMSWPSTAQSSFLN